MHDMLICRYVELHINDVRNTPNASSKYNVSLHSERARRHKFPVPSCQVEVFSYNGSVGDINGPSEFNF